MLLLIYRDSWDRDHVRMPCSKENLYPVSVLFIPCYLYVCLFVYPFFSDFICSTVLSTPVITDCCSKDRHSFGNIILMLDLFLCFYYVNLCMRMISLNAEQK